jgi:hypothetical protein
VAGNRGLQDLVVVNMKEIAIIELYVSIRKLHDESEAYIESIGHFVALNNYTREFGLINVHSKKEIAELQEILRHLKVKYLLRDRR